MPAKAIDSRIPTLLKNGVQEKQRSFFVIVGDRGREQIVNLHYLLGKMQITARPNVLWMYKKDLLGFTSHRKKRENKIKKEVKRGIREANQEDPFELFVSVTDIRYCYYKESDKILGQTFGMLVLQDFEALTPNILARTIETVQGGGAVILLLKSMTSLKQLYTMSMDIHARYRTEAHGDVVSRFNERFILSLASCENCLVVDDELNVLPLSGARNIKPIAPANEQVDAGAQELKTVKDELAGTVPVGALVALSRTVDQARAILTFNEAITDKKLRSTVALTAARGRGKSAALGLAIAAAIAHGYSNIFVTSPSPENLKTLFEFVFKGFDALDYEEHLDYDLIQSTNPSFNKAIVRVNVFKQHRQTIQYIQPADSHVLGQAELVIIDEAAAIPLTLVKNLLGPYLVFMASTINGYEGTGRSLSLKLIQQLREQSRGYVSKDKALQGDVVVSRSGKGVEGATGGRLLREISLEEPIRYATNDPVERWLNTLLCLNATTYRPKDTGGNHGFPHPSTCSLYAVNRDTLFSFHPVSEAFLQRMVGLYVSSHYKNSPNDLQLMSDAPAHNLFVLLPPVESEKNKLPEPLCVIQVVLEGEVSRDAIMNSLSRGQRMDGDLIPWTMAQQYQDREFARLGGARIIRIASSPEYAGMGYGSQALRLLTDYYQGKFASLRERGPALEQPQLRVISQVELSESGLHTDTIRVRSPSTMPPLLSDLSQVPPPRLEYLGVAFGLTQQLHTFWRRAGFVPFYLRQTTNDLTGEHSAVMLRLLHDEPEPWFADFARDFQRRFSTLLSYHFSEFTTVLALSVMDAVRQGCGGSNAAVAGSEQELNATTLAQHFSMHDRKRLEAYAGNMVDYHVIVDQLPRLAQLYFIGAFGDETRLSSVQQAVLLGLGLQRKSIDDLERELNLPNSQLLAMLTKIVRKMSTRLQELEKQGLKNEQQEKTNEERATVAFEQPLAQTLEEEQDEDADEAMKQLREKQKAMLDAMDMSQYAIGADRDFATAEAQVGGGANASTTVSVKADRDRRATSRDHRGKKRKQQG